MINAIGDVAERASEELSQNELTLLQNFVSDLDKALRCSTPAECLTLWSTVISIPAIFEEQNEP